MTQWQWGRRFDLPLGEADAQPGAPVHGIAPTTVVWSRAMFQCCPECPAKVLRTLRVM